MPVSRLDTAYRSLVLSKFFSKGWGKPENLKRLFEFRKIISNRETCYKLVPDNYPVTITKEVVTSGSVLLEGHFPSPFSLYLPGLVPEISENAYFQILLPKKWESDQFKPICLHLAGTGDHFFFRRRNLMAKPLLKTAGIGAILLENPFYGIRKPTYQNWSCLHNVSDIFVMGGCLILESLVLFHWCKRNGFGPLGVTGISMGGHMASLAATSWPEPIVLVPCLSWSTASGVFTKGVMSEAIDWQQLENQYFSDEVYSKEIKNMVKVIDDDTFKAGRHFAKHFPDSLEHVHEISNKENIKLNINNPPPLTFKKNENFAQQTSLANNDVLKEVLIESESTDLLQRLELAQNKPIENKQKLSNYFSWGPFKREEGDSSKKVEPKSKKEKKVDERTDKQKFEAQQFMCGIMDECTHLSNFSVPTDTELIISVVAKDDAYVPTEGFTSLADIWPGAEIRCVNTGHVGAYLLHQKVFRSAIIDAFEKLRAKYHPDVQWLPVTAKENVRKSAELKNENK